MAHNIPSPSKQVWDAGLYERRHAFVYHLAADLLELLAPRAGESIVDLGCGTGQLTAEIAQRGARVLGLDLSSEMIARARQNYPDVPFETADAVCFLLPEPVDAVFSNATLHWVLQSEESARAIFRALRPGGRFVAEFGGQGCVRWIVEATTAALASVRGGAAGDAPVARQWYFPSVGQYAAVLERVGFEVRMATLFDRPTPLDEGEQGLRNWLRMFAGAALSTLSAAEQETVFQQTEAALRPALWNGTQWVADYRRIRVSVVRPDALPD